MMNWRIGAAVVLAAGAAFGFEARAQVEENAAKVLQDSAAAITKINGITYRSKLYGVGALKDIMDGEGEIRQVRVAGKSGRNAPASINGAVKELGKGKTPIKAATDGAIVEWIDDPSNTHFKRPATDRNDAQRVMSLGSQLVVAEFSEPEPFSKQLKAQKVELKSNEQVQGVDCQVVLVSWENGLRSEMWWIGTGDKLPRKIEMAHGQNRDLAKGTEIWEVKLTPDLTLADLALKAPAGYKEDFQTAPPPPPVVKQPVQPNTPPAPPPVVGIPPGTTAPEFDLKSNGGTSVKLSSLKGNVVVLTFGGSRFPKTDVVNGIVGQVVEANKGKNVQAFTLACREESDEAAIEHAKKAGVSFPVLLGADTVRNEYRVAGFPFTYVLTADGRVSKAFQGNVSRQQLDQAVEAALRGEVAPTIAPVPVAPPAPVTIKPAPGTALPNLSPTNKK
jgi:peroxiredoxin